MKIGMVRLTRRNLDAWHALRSPGVEIVDAGVKGEASVVVSAGDTVRAEPLILEQVERIKDEVDAIMIMCFGDPAISDARDLAEVPVVGLGESAMFFATQRARRFSIATVLERGYAEELVAKKGYTDRLASVHQIDVKVPNLRDDRAATVDSVAREMRVARDKHGTEAVVLGCAGLSGLSADVEAALGLPCIDPVWPAFKIAESGHDLSQALSPRGDRLAVS